MTAFAYLGALEDHETHPREPYWRRVVSAAVDAEETEAVESDYEDAVDITPYALEAPRESSALPALSQRVLDSMRATSFDFRTVDSLAEELDASPTEVRIALMLLGGQVRHPIGGNKRFRDLYRLDERGLTRKERWWRWRAIAGRTSL